MNKNFIIFNEQNVNFQFNKAFSKKERLLFNFLIKDKESILNKNLTISLLKIKKLLSIIETENIFKVFQKLIEKNISYTIFKLDILERKGSFSIISSYYIEKNFIIINFTEEFSSIFKKNSYFQKNNFDILIFFQNNYAIILYNFFKFNIAMNRPIEISIKKIKEILNLSKMYDRFFDFEKIVLKPAIEEIRQITKKKIEYQKIKNKDASNSKIIGLLFEISDIKEKEKIEITNNIMKKIELVLTISNEDRNYLWDKIFKSLENRSVEQVMKNINYSLAHYPKGNFKIFLEEALDFNYAENRFKNKINKFSETFKSIENIEKKYLTLAQFHTDLFKILANLKCNYITLNPKFLKSLQSLNLKKELEYFDNNFVIFAEYNENEISYISFFET